MPAAPEFHPRLVEEAVRAALRGRGEQAAFHREREAVYLRPEGPGREAAFDALHGRWFERLGLAAPVAEVLAGPSGPAGRVSRILLLPAAGDRHEGAELYVSGPADAAAGRKVIVSMRPETLSDPAAALAFLHREMLHVADMLDPEFLYEPRLPEGAPGPARDRIVRDRYRVLWDVSVDGRLARQGLLPGPVREARRQEFEAAFSMLGGSCGACFTALFDGPRPGHPRLAAMALDPAAGFGLEGRAGGLPERCPLCGFPRAGTEWPGIEADSELAARIRADFPHWSPGTGACRQCADLYAARLAAAVPRA